MFLPTLLIAFSSVPSAAPAAPAHVLETADAQRVEATLTYTVRCEKVTAKEWIVFAGELPVLPGQTNVKSRLEPGGKPAKEAGPLGRPVLMARVPVKGKDLATGIPIRVTYEATLRSRRLRPLVPGEKPPAVEALSDKERKAALAAQGPIDFRDAAVAKWLKEHKLLREKAESDVDLARRAFVEIRSGYRYEYLPEQDRRASALCKAGGTDCGGLSNLFVAAMRANGVPARTLMGRWALSAAPAEKVGESPYYQAHVKAEFFAEGVGWVPVDVAAAVLHDRTPEGLHFFGSDKGDLLTFHCDADLELDVGRFGKQTVYGLQVPAYWVSGTGSPDPRTVKEDWQVRKLP